MLAAMIQVVTLVLMKSSCYTFGGYIYLQQTGSGIGLRASACAAKVVMAVWDICWARIQKACGLKVNIFMRYIDDIRIYLKAIARGWRWNKSKWEYIGVDEDERNDETRTKEELKKSFESIFPFLGFTTEAQEDFETGYLPTLDTQTHVNEIGLILYKHFDKPMASNTTLQKGTALSKSTVFSSLRQDLCRRLLNTSKLESGEVFNKVVEDYTQILINSGHQYSFVKAIILQGITRYKYMVARSERMPTDPKYRPLYRPRTYQRNERLILKRIQQSTWFQDGDLGDPWRQGWKRKITNNIRRKPNMKRLGERNVTSVLFVPATKGSELFNAVCSGEDEISSKLSWTIKIVEKGGTQLSSIFMNKSPVIEGCPLGSDCVVCENDAVQCSKRGVVYKASCETCKSANRVSEDGTGFEYIGETSRPVRSRVKEHMDSLHNLNPTSFQVAHWMDIHSTDTSPPNFSFKVIGVFSDPLSRQLSEAVNIMHTGNLNKKTEFQINDLYRMVSEQDNFTQQKESEKKKHEKAVFDAKMANFVSVMDCIYTGPRGEKNNTCDAFRSHTLKRNLAVVEYTGEQEVVRETKRRKMQCSTPISQYREEVEEESPDMPPIALQQREGSPFLVDPSIFEENSGDISDDLVRERKKTNVSDPLDILQLTPVSELSSDTHARNMGEMAAGVERNLAKRGLMMIQRSRSEPELHNNALFKAFPRARYRSMSMADYLGDADVGLWNSGSSFGNDNSQRARGGEVIMNTENQPDNSQRARGGEVIMNTENQPDNSQRARGGEVIMNTGNQPDNSQRARGGEEHIVQSDAKVASKEDNASEIFIMDSVGLMDNLNIATPARGKRVLSPDELTPVGVSRKMSTTVNSSPLLRMNFEYWGGDSQGVGEIVKDEIGGNAITDGGSGRDNRNPIRRLILGEDDVGMMPHEQDVIPNTPPLRRRVLSVGVLSRTRRNDDSTSNSPRRQRTISSGSGRGSRGRGTPRNQPLIKQFTQMKK